MRKPKVFYSTLFFIVFSLVLTSCDGSSRSMFKADNAIEFDTITMEERYFLDEKPENPSCNLILNVIYPQTSTRFDVEKARRLFVNAVFGANYDSLSIQEASELYAKNYIDNYKNDAQIYKVNKPILAAENDSEELFHADDDHELLPEIFYSYYETLTDTIVYNHYGIISFQVRQANNKGGTMSYETVKNYVVNLNNGELMTEGDIFSAGYDLALRPIIQAYLLDQNGVKTIADLEDLGYFGIDEILPNKNFLLTDKGIIYTFNKGEYSAYQLPCPEIFIPYSAVLSLLRENSVALKLSKL